MKQHSAHAQIVSIWGHRRLSDPQEESWEASHGPWTEAPWRSALLCPLSKHPRGASSQAGAFLCGNARKITPRCVRGGGLLLVRSPEEQLCIGRGFGQISSLLSSFKFLSCKMKG